MGQNKRYDLVSGEMDRLNARLAREPSAVSLTDEHLRGSGRRRGAPESIPVHTLVPHQIAYVETIPIEAEAIAWTGAAVLVRWQISGHDKFAWVWAGAVRKIN